MPADSPASLAPGILDSLLATTIEHRRHLQIEKVATHRRCGALPWIEGSAARSTSVYVCAELVRALPPSTCSRTYFVWAPNGACACAPPVGDCEAEAVYHTAVASLFSITSNFTELLLTGPTGIGPAPTSHDTLRAQPRRLATYTRCGLHGSGPGMEWPMLNRYPDTPAGCAALVLAQPASAGCSSTHFNWALHTDHNCACAPTGAECDDGGKDRAKSEALALYSFVVDRSDPSLSVEDHPLAADVHSKPAKGSCALESMWPKGSTHSHWPTSVELTCVPEKRAEIAEALSEYATMMDSLDFNRTDYNVADVYGQRGFQEAIYGGPEQFGNSMGWLLNSIVIAVVSGRVLTPKYNGAPEKAAELETVLPQRPWMRKAEHVQPFERKGSRFVVNFGVTSETRRESKGDTSLLSVPDLSLRNLVCSPVDDVKKAHTFRINKMEHTQSFLMGLDAVPFLRESTRARARVLFSLGPFYLLGLVLTMAFDWAPEIIEHSLAVLNEHGVPAAGQPDRWVAAVHARHFPHLLTEHPYTEEEYAARMWSPALLLLRQARAASVKPGGPSCHIVVATEQPEFLSALRNVTADDNCVVVGVEAPAADHEVPNRRIGEHGARAGFGVVMDLHMIRSSAPDIFIGTDDSSLTNHMAAAAAAGSHGSVLPPLYSCEPYGSCIDLLARSPAGKARSGWVKAVEEAVARCPCGKPCATHITVA